MHIDKSTPLAEKSLANWRWMHANAYCIAFFAFEGINNRKRPHHRCCRLFRTICIRFAFNKPVFYNNRITKKCIVFRFRHTLNACECSFIVNAWSNAYWYDGIPIFEKVQIMHSHLVYGDAAFLCFPSLWAMYKCPNGVRFFQSQYIAAMHQQCTMHFLAMHEQCMSNAWVMHNAFFGNAWAMHRQCTMHKF